MKSQLKVMIQDQKKKEKPNTDSDSSSSESVSEDASKKNSQTLKSTSVKKKSQSGNYTAYEQLDITKGNQYRTRVIYKILKTSHFLSFPSINKIQIICNVSYNWDFWKCITQEDIKNLYIGDALRRYKKRKKLTFKLFKREYGRMSTDEKDTILEEFAKYQILKTKFNFLEDYFTEQLNNRKAQLSQPRKRKKKIKSNKKKNKKTQKTKKQKKKSKKNSKKK
ncbi:hypothetical protein M0813_19683 [Anaeramoeba flamelloides]|uniref:Uncharacterized protein n=1 Tax=Anaeramoeba flamelloides TaxID=1746091 RepID=A0ABQ8YN62_9EUKA|nr:hypothetical protein M0813_19683 [Anaeramoeba flamelloides]